MSIQTVRAFRIGAWSWLVTGAGHLSLVLASELRPADPDGAAAADAMRAYAVPLPVVGRSLYDVDRGMSLVMGVALVFAGLVCLLAVRAAPQVVTRSLTAVCLAASLVVLALAAWLLPLPPIVLFTVACVAFGWSLLTARPSPAAHPEGALAQR